MSKASSILASEPAPAFLTRGVILRRLAMFFAPIALVAGIGVAALARTGELLPVRWIASMHGFEMPMLYLPEFSDHLYRYKIEVARRVRPDVLVIGSSRSNQWRSGMFAGTSFYNAGNSMYLPVDFSNVLEELGNYSPRVLLFSLDDFMFNERFAKDVRQRSKSEFGSIGSAEFRHVMRKTISRLLNRPGLLVSQYRDPVHGVPALGFSAVETGLGFRADGSVQYGDVILGGSRQNPEEAAKNIAANGQWPGYGGDRMDEALMKDLETFAGEARKRGIALVAITPGMHPSIVSSLRESPAHASWRQFHSAETRDWLRGLGILHFDFTDISTFGGRRDEFIDGFHPSEPAYLRMLLRMVENPHFAKLFPSINKADVTDTLANASRHEAYVNRF